MKLNVKQRIVLLGTLSGVTGNLTELRIIRELKESLSFTEEEHTELGLKEVEGKLFWNAEADEPREVEIGDTAKSIIVQRLRKLNREGELAEDHLDIIDLFPEAES